MIVSRNPLALLLASLIIAIPLVVTIDPVSAGVALILEVPILLLCGLTAKEFFLRTLAVWIAAPLGMLTIALYGMTSGRVYFEWLLIRVSDGSLQLALSTGLRVFAVALPAVALFAKIDPTRLADALAQCAKLPARFVIGALAGMRMMGLLVEDWRSLGLARRARGVADQGRIRRGLGMAFAVFVLSIRRGTSLATAMEARGFGGPTPRTWARPSNWEGKDTLFVALCALIPAIALTAAVLTGSFRFVLG